MIKRFIDHIVTDYELPIPLFKRSNKTIFPACQQNKCLLSWRCIPTWSALLVSGLSSKCNAIATLFDCSSCSKKDFANQQALAQDIKVRKDITNSLCNQTLNIQNVLVSAVLISTWCLTSTRTWLVCCALEFKHLNICCVDSEKAT